ncbi:MAG: PAS domain S-box protein [Desulfobacteraceae bacterium]|nr:PAS domain S-box protein [Desulfobacteraceae bacterium]
MDTGITHSKTKRRPRTTAPRPKVVRRTGQSTVSNETCRNRLILESMAEAYFETDLNGRLTFCNPAFCRLLGRPEQEVIQSPISAHLTADGAAMIRAAFEEVNRTKQSSDRKPIVFVSKEGARLETETALHLLPDSSGEATGFGGLALDVTEKSVLKKRLRESENKYQHIMESAPYSITVFRISDGRYVQVSKGFCEYTGYSAEEAVGRSAKELNLHLTPEDEQQVIAALERERRIDRLEMPFRTKDGRIIDTIMSARPVRFNGEPCYLSIATDITPIKGAQKALQESQARYHAILEATPDPICLTRLSDGKYIEANSAFYQRSGYTPEEIIGRTSTEINLYLNAADRARLVAELNKTGLVRDIEMPIRNKDGSVSLDLWSCRTLQFHGEPHLVVIAKNINELKASQRALQESEESYRAILDTVPHVITISRITDFRYVLVNQAFSARTGYSAEEVLGQSFFDFNHFGDDAERDRLVETIRRDNKVDGLEMKFRTKDGALSSALVSSRIIFYRNEPCILFIATNIDALKEAQRVITESEKSYRTILDSAPYAITISRIADGKYIHVNDAFCENTGYSREEVLGRTTLDLNIYADLADRERMLEKLRKTGRVEDMEITYRLKDGRTTEALASARAIYFKDELCLIFISTNISELKSAQRALEESEESHRTILDTAPFSIGITRLSDMAYVQVNESFCQRSGYSKAEVIGVSALKLDLFADPGERERVLETYRRVGRVDGMEVRFRTKDGSLRESLLSVRPIRFKNEDCMLAISADVTALKETQRALEEREERNRTILEAAPYSIAITRRSNNTFVQVNEAFCRRTGYRREEILGHTAFELKLYDNPDDRRRMLEILHQEGQVDGLELRFRDKNEILLESMLSSRVIRYGGEDCLLTITVDITAIKTYQNALRESEEGYRAILESAPYSVVVTRLSDSRYMQVNEAFCRRTGYTREEAVGRTPYDLNIYVDPTARARMLERFNRDGRVDGMEVQLRAKDGRILDSLFSVNPIRYKGQDCLLAMTVDIGELKRTQIALEASEQRYRNILANIEEGYWEVDLRGTFTFVNEAEARIHRSTLQELVGKNNRSFSKPNTSQEIYKIFNKVYKTGIPAQIFDYELLREDGTEAVIELSASLRRDEAGNPIGFFGISRDITEKKRTERELEKYRHRLEEMVLERTKALEAAQQELVKREKLAVLGQLTATVSHELRNPLGVIRSSNYYLQRKVKSGDEKIDKHFKRIEEQVTQCDAIVGDLLEYTRGRNASMVLADMRTWINDLITQIQELESIAIDRELSDKLPIVPHDPEKMRRVLINLIDNAILAVKDKQGKENGDSTGYRPAIKVAAYHSNDQVVIEVIDNGIGMNAETQQHAFEPLFTTRARGTGIGLANVKKIIAEHHGSINLVSESGQGTTVIVKLPCRA